MPRSKEDKRSYDIEYISRNIHQKTLSFNRKIPEDEELYEWISKQKNQAQYIKTLIRRDLELHKTASENPGE